MMKKIVFSFVFIVCGFVCKGQEKPNWDNRLYGFSPRPHEFNIYFEVYPPSSIIGAYYYDLLTPEVAKKWKVKSVAEKGFGYNIDTSFVSNFFYNANGYLSRVNSGRLRSYFYYDDNKIVSRLDSFQADVWMVTKVFYKYSSDEISFYPTYNNDTLTIKFYKNGSIQFIKDSYGSIYYGKNKKPIKYSPFPCDVCYKYFYDKHENLIGAKEENFSYKCINKYDSLNRIVETKNLTTGEKRTFEYDNLNRLIKTTIYNLNKDGGYFEFDCLLIKYDSKTGLIAVLQWRQADNKIYKQQNFVYEYY